MNNDPQSCLYPELNDDRDGDGSPEKDEKYREFVTKLDVLVDDARNSYREYRLEAKKYLQI
jgi:hypothetical protein